MEDFTQEEAEERRDQEVGFVSTEMQHQQNPKNNLEPTRET